MISYSVQQQKSNGIDGKVGEHVGQPGPINAAQLFVQPIKDQAADGQPQEHQSVQSKAEPADHHGNVISCKQNCADAIGNPWFGLGFDVPEQKAPEEELFQ